MQAICRQEETMADIFAGKALATVKLNSDPQVATVRPNVLAAPESDAGATATVEPVAALTDNVRAVLFRNARELLMNVVKHAKAGEVSVCMETSGDMLRIMVEDDGVGFDPETLVSRPNHEGAFGLFSIRERLRSVDGRMLVDSQPCEGCRIFLSFPMPGKG